MYMQSQLFSGLPCEIFRDFILFQRHKLFILILFWLICEIILPTFRFFELQIGFVLKSITNSSLTPNSDLNKY